MKFPKRDFHCRLQFLKSSECDDQSILQCASRYEWIFWLWCKNNPWNLPRGVHRQQEKPPHTTTAHQAERETWNDNPDRQVERVQRPGSTWLHSPCCQPPTGIHKPNNRSSYQYLWGHVVSRKETHVTRIRENEIRFHLLGNGPLWVCVVTETQPNPQRRFSTTVLQPRDTSTYEQDFWLKCEFIW